MKVRDSGGGVAAVMVARGLEGLGYSDCDAVRDCEEPCTTEERGTVKVIWSA